MLVFNIQHFSVHDGDGIRTVIFLKGCPLRCAWCHNPEGIGMKAELSYDAGLCSGCRICEVVCPKKAHVFRDMRKDENALKRADDCSKPASESIPAPESPDTAPLHIFLRERCVSCGKCADACPSGAVELIGREYSVEELLREVKKDAVFYGDDGGVTVSGGEPFAQADNLIELLKALKDSGYNTAVETSGLTSPENIRRAAAYTDSFLYDCKLIDNARHLEYTGAGNQLILSNLSILDELGAKVTLRCPIIPSVNDNVKHITALAELIRTHASIKSAELEPYHPTGLRKYPLVGRSAGYDRMTGADAEKCRSLLAILHEKSGKPVKLS